MLADGTGGNGSTEPSLGVAVVVAAWTGKAALAPAHRSNATLRRDRFFMDSIPLDLLAIIDHGHVGHRHFFRYSIVVLPILPLKANGAWSK